MSQAVKELSMEEFKSLIGQVVDEKLAPLTKVDRKWGAFPGVKEEELDQLAWAEKFKIFLRALVRGQVEVCTEMQRHWGTEAQIKQLTEGADTAGGFLVPEEFRAEVIRIIPKYGVFRRLARVIPMNTDTLRIPRQTATVSVSWPGEAKKGTGSKPTLGQVLLNAKTMVGLCSYSLEFLADAGLPVIQYLQTIFAEEFGAEEDNQAFNGTGVPFIGVLNAAGVNTAYLGGSSTSGKTTIGSATIDDMIDAADKTTEDADEGAVYVFNKALKTVLRKVKVTSTYAWAEASKDAPGTLNGYPWYTSKKLPNVPGVNTAFAIYGNFGYAFLGDREQMTIAITREGTIGADNLFEQNMAGLRITERIAIDIAVPSAFTVIKTAAS